MADVETRDYDVVVVGCGVAGLSAAISALECGARVAVVERATVEERGGNTRYTGASIRMASESEISPDFEGMFAANAGYHLDPLLVAETAADYANWPAIVKTMPAMDPEVIGTLADAAPGTIAWLKQQGVKFGEMAFYGLTERSSPRIGVTGGGLALVYSITRLAKQKRWSRFSL